jgi:uncharacterized protein
MKPVYRSNLFALIVILGQILGTLFLGRILYQTFGLYQVLVLSQILFLIVPTIIYFAVTKQPVGDSLKLKRIALADIGLVIAIAVLSQPVASFLSALTGMFFKNPVNEILGEITKIPYLYQLGIVALTPAICEEVTMRGIVLSGYKKISNWKAALVTGFLFGILHLNPQQFLYAFILGILFAYLVRITNSIYSAVICHFMFNGVQVTLANVMTRVNPDMIKDAPDYTKMSIADKFSVLLPLFFMALFFGFLVILCVRELDKLNKRRAMLGVSINTSQVNYNKDQLGYLARGNERENEVETGEGVVNAPLIATIIISLAFMAFVEIMLKK